MRPGSRRLDEVLKNSYAVRLVADVFYDDERVIVNAPVTDDFTFTWDAEQAVKFTGTVKLAWQGDNGETLTPSGLLDPLAPFGQEMALLAKVSFGQTYTETILLGRFPIRAVPSSTDSWFGFNGRGYVSGSVVTVHLVDLLDTVRRSSFRWPGIPRFATSTWAEIQYVSGLPVARNLPDRPPPGELVYQPGPGGRLTALQQLMSYLGGVAVVNSGGQVTSLPYATDSVPQVTLEMGRHGTVVDVVGGLDSTEVFNEVVGTYQSYDGVPLFAAAWIDSGPLAISGPYGACTAPTDSDTTVTTQTDAYDRVRKVLQQYLAAQTVRYTVTCIFDPRTEIGDVVTVNGPRTHRVSGGYSDPLFVIVGRVISVGWAGSDIGLMTVVVDVGAALEATISVGT